MDPTSRVPGREYYRIRGYRQREPEENRTQNAEQVQSQDTSRIPNQEDTQLGLNELFHEKESNTQKNIFLLASLNAKITQENTITLNENPFLHSQPVRNDLLDVHVQRLESKKDIFQKLSDHYAEGTFKINFMIGLI